MKIVWDEPKRGRNLSVHGYDFADVFDFDWDVADLMATYTGERGDRRFKAVGLVDDVLVTIVFASLGTEAISIISFRRSSRKEKRDYEARRS